MRSSAVPLSLLGAFILVIPAAGMPGVPASAGGALALPEKTATVAAPPPSLQVIVAERPGVRVIRAVRAEPAQTAPPPARFGVPAPARQPAQAARPAPASRRTYTIQSGDTLWNIAQRHGVTVEGLAAANRLAISATLRPGFTLAVPSGTSPAAPAKPARAARGAGASRVAHVVQSGETLWEIAKVYGTSVEALMAINDLGDSDWIKPGQRLTISGGTLPRYRQIPQAAPGRAGASKAEDASLARRLGELEWPSRGVLTSRFGWRYRRHHDGIDLAAPHGTPIYATRDGVVDFAGWHSGYGRVVYIDHGGGLVTVYGHASTLVVQSGQQVKRGQVIGLVGCTGACTGSHVHFEVRVNGRPIDPLPFLR